MRSFLAFNKKKKIKSLQGSTAYSGRQNSDVHSFSETVTEVVSKVRDYQSL